MANTLTGLIPVIYESLDKVSRELVGLIPAVNMDTQSSRAALNQTVRSPVAPASTPVSISPGVTAPDTGDQTVGYTDVSISKQYQVPVRWNGDEQASLASGQYTRVLMDQFSQAFRGLANLVEADLAGLHTKASRAYGTAGTNPFGASSFNHDSVPEVRKILVDNGQASDLQLVINTAAGANMRKISNLYKVNEAGDRNFLRQGVLDDLHGFMIRESAQIKTSTAGTMASATTTAAALTVGQTVIPLATAGTGVVAAGDIITIANDTNKYVVKSVSFAGANPASGDSITIAAPGIRVAQASSAYAITVIAAAARNMAFAKNAITLATRLPMRPQEGDSAYDVMVVTDPVSGLSFEVAMYKQYRQIHFEVALAWGYAATKPEGIALLLG